MPKERNELVDRLVYFGLRFVSMCVHCFPVNANLQTARMLGWMWYTFDRRHQKRAMANLHQSFPHFSEAKCRRIALQSLQSMFMLGVEVLHTTRLIRIDTWRNYVELGNFRETLRLLMARNQGLIIVTGHYGNWEILGYVLATLGFETTSVARPLDNPYLNEWVFGVRERHGQKVVGKRGATAEVSRLLQSGGVVGFVADQNAGTKGLFVDFFGRKASTYKSIGLLAMEYQVPVVIGYARRKEGRFHFEIATQDIIWPADWKSESDPLTYITQRYTRSIEDFVRCDPGQYLWLHRRWRTRPKGEAPLQYD